MGPIMTWLSSSERPVSFGGFGGKHGDREECLKRRSVGLVSAKPRIQKYSHFFIAPEKTFCGQCNTGDAINTWIVRECVGIDGALNKCGAGGGISSHGQSLHYQ